jgi:predicted ribosome quality control (RQC) complex YloA/Tae2 family protein
MGAEREELERLYRERGQRRPQWWEFPVQTAVSYALARGREGLGTFYARQLCYRCGIDPEAPLGSLTAEQYARLEEGLRAFCGELQDSRCALLLRRPGSSPLLSLVPLQEYPEVVRSFASIHEAVAECVRQRLLWEELQRRRAELQQTLERYHRQVLSQLEAADVHQQQAERVELYRLWGTLLLAQPNLRQRGQEQLELPDWEGRLHRIELDPAKTVQENAERYFRQARRLEESVQRAQQRIPQLRALRERLEQLLQEVQRADSLRYVQHLARQVAELFPPREVQTPTGERFRVFPLGKGFTLYVGKDARSNEALTFGFARPHDLFLHVRQGSGAHGILRGGAKGQLPPEEILRQAAAIVAYYSSARTADWVPVLYTWRKYVRKVKGVPGAVRTEREELVWVEPRAPTE